MSKKKNFPIRIPRYATGIRAQNLRTGGTWWEKRWLAAIASKDLGGRLGRGKNYALSGQVVELNIDGPHVAAQVVGTRKGSYGVTIDFRTPEGAARKRIVAALKSEPMLVARMLANDLPTEVETIFNREGYDLFPGGKLKVAGGTVDISHSSVRPPTSTSQTPKPPKPQTSQTSQTSLTSLTSQTPLYDMTTRCSCPDYANPCKHSHAVLLILGEEVTRRPATLVELRGIKMEELY